jgi:hypothetical protein
MPPPLRSLGKGPRESSPPRGPGVAAFDFAKPGDKAPGASQLIELPEIRGLVAETRLAGKDDQALFGDDGVAAAQ